MDPHREREEQEPEGKDVENWEDGESQNACTRWQGVTAIQGRGERAEPDDEPPGAQRGETGTCQGPNPRRSLRFQKQPASNEDEHEVRRGEALHDRCKTSDLSDRGGLREGIP